PCAIKIVRGRFDGTAKSAQMAFNELQALRTNEAINGHPRFVYFYGAWIVANQLVSAWELCGESLSGRVSKRQAQGLPGIPHDELAKYMIQVAEGLDFLNTQKIYHRDVKPGNVLLVNSEAKIGDLGIAKVLVESSGSHTGSGTWGYMPPE